MVHNFVVLWTNDINYYGYDDRFRSMPQAPSNLLILRLPSDCSRLVPMPALISIPSLIASWYGISVQKGNRLKEHCGFKQNLCSRPQEVSGKQEFKICVYWIVDLNQNPISLCQILLPQLSANSFCWSDDMSVEFWARLSTLTMLRCWLQSDICIHLS